MKPRHALFVAMVVAACVPEGNSTPSEAGAGPNLATPTFHPSANIMTAPFEDAFERTSKPLPPLNIMPSASAASSAPGVPSGSAQLPQLALSSSSGGPVPAPPDDLGPNWRQASTNAWHIENGRLCAQNGQNHGVWLTKVLPVNARIEFDAIAETPQGDLKAEVWGDGQSHATAQSYTNATSYLAIFGGWKNKFHVLARINEHGNDRKQIIIDAQSDDPKEKPVVAGQSYHFKIERTDGKTVHWAVNGLDYLSFEDSQPLAGQGHDHFGFNDWDVKVCFDNVKVVPLP
jgi:hypothetical protein